MTAIDLRTPDAYEQRRSLRERLLPQVTDYARLRKRRDREAECDEIRSTIRLYLRPGFYRRHRPLNGGRLSERFAFVGIAEHSETYRFYALCLPMSSLGAPECVPLELFLGVYDGYQEEPQFRGPLFEFMDHCDARTLVAQHWPRCEPTPGTTAQAGYWCGFKRKLALDPDENLYRYAAFGTARIEPAKRSPEPVMVYTGLWPHAGHLLIRPLFGRDAFIERIDRRITPERRFIGPRFKLERRVPHAKLAEHLR